MWSPLQVGYFYRLCLVSVIGQLLKFFSDSLLSEFVVRQSLKNHYYEQSTKFNHEIPALKAKSGNHFYGNAIGTKGDQMSGPTRTKLKLGSNKTARSIFLAVSSVLEPSY